MHGCKSEEKAMSDIKRKRFRGRDRRSPSEKLIPRKEEKAEGGGRKKHWDGILKEKRTRKTTFLGSSFTRAERVRVLKGGRQISRGGMKSYSSSR